VLQVTVSFFFHNQLTVAACSTDTHWKTAEEEAEEEEEEEETTGK
jgi:hypothetical protein